jgi:hypothetical protein
MEKTINKEFAQIIIKVENDYQLFNKFLHLRL